jgi:colanic acid/amylovoran biosynthesis glycosyltransferase
MNRYLGISEVFIWYYLKNLQKFRPLVLAAERDNLDQFPLDNGELFTCRPHKSLFFSMVARIMGRYASVDYSPCYGELEQHSIDLIHAHYGYRALVSMNLAARMNCPFITSFYGFDLSHKKYLQRALDGYQALFKRGAAFFVEGPCMREKIYRLGCPWDKIHIQRIAIESRNYTFNHRSWDEERPVKFLFVGRFVEKKGLLDALMALHKIKGAFKWAFTVVGDGPQRKEVERLICDYTLEHCVTLTGYASPHSLPDYFANHDILLQPSRIASDGDSEGGAPTVLLEAQASGMPIVSTLHDDIPNVVREGRNALLSEEGNIEGVYNNLMKMVENHKTWPRMADMGLAHVLENHDISKEVEVLEKKYFSLLS